MDPMELLAHPVRLRIVHAMSGGSVLTTAQLSARMPDISKATVYRHVDLLAEHGILEVARAQRVRGVVERGYRLRRERAVVDAETATTADHRRIFPIAMAILLTEFQAYLQSDDADPTGDLVGYRQHAVWLSHDELTELITDLRAAILPRLSNAATGDRAPYLLSPILFPLAQSPEGDAT